MSPSNSSELRPSPPVTITSRCICLPKRIRQPSGRRDRNRSWRRPLSEVRGRQVSAPVHCSFRPFLPTPFNGSPVGREIQVPAAIHLNSVAARFVEVHEEGLADAVTSGTGLDFYVLLNQNVGRAHHLFSRILGKGQVVEPSLDAAWIKHVCDIV